MKRFLPGTIFAQLALLIVGAVLLANGAGLLMLLVGQNHLGPHPAEITGRIAGFVELLDKTPPAERDALIAKIGQSHPELSIRQVIGPQPARAVKRPGPAHLERALGRPFSVVTQPAAAPQTGQEHLIRLADGSFISAREPPSDPPLLGPHLFSWLFVGFSLIGVALWTGWRIARPLQDMTRAVEGFRPEMNPRPLAEAGPYEIRALASAFNRMQTRIGELLTDKTNALAAVSHDLRTPITRMRLRAEFMTDTLERERMIHDLDTMDHLTRSALNYLKNVKDGSNREKVDLASLIHSIADRHADAGKTVTVDIQARPSVVASALDLERVIDNLIENAFKYATPPVIRLREKDQDAVIEIEDRGPGIPALSRETMTRPFTRGDRARSMEQVGGFGMGLAIARDTVLRQGGSFELLDAEPTGLLIRITLQPA